MSDKWKQFEESLKGVLNESKAVRKLDSWLKEWRVEKEKGI
jgi:hypothetical protein